MIAAATEREGEGMAQWELAGSLLSEISPDKINLTDLPRIRNEYAGTELDALADGLYLFISEYAGGGVSNANLIIQITVDTETKIQWQLPGIFEAGVYTRKTKSDGSWLEWDKLSNNELAKNGVDATHANGVSIVPKIVCNRNSVFQSTYTGCWTEVYNQSEYYHTTTYAVGEGKIEIVSIVEVLPNKTASVVIFTVTRFLSVYDEAALPREKTTSTVDFVDSAGNQVDGEVGFSYSSSSRSCSVRFTPNEPLPAGRYYVEITVA